MTAPFEGGELLTKPLKFSGRQLKLNVSTSAAGAIRVGLEDVDGKPLRGYAMEDCDPVIGDGIEETVSWKGKAELSAFANRPVRLRIHIKDADLYAYQFVG